MFHILFSRSYVVDKCNFNLWSVRQQNRSICYWLASCFKRYIAYSSLVTFNKINHSSNTPSLIDSEVWLKVKMFLAQHAQNWGDIENVRSACSVDTRLMCKWSNFCRGNNITATKTSAASEVIWLI